MYSSTELLVPRYLCLIFNLQYYSCARSVRLDPDKIRLCGGNAGFPIHFNEGSPFQLQWCWLQGPPTQPLEKM